MAVHDDRMRLFSLVEGISDNEMRALGMQALRAWFEKVPALAAGLGIQEALPYTVAVHALGLEIIRLLIPRSPATFTAEEINLMKEPFIDSFGMRWMQPFTEFIYWLERSGLAVATQQNSEGTSTNLRITKRGVLALSHPDDHPLLPGFLERVQAHCPGLPDGVVALLVDARACLGYSLLRAAVVLMGVAYEIAISEVADRLQTTNAFGIKSVAGKQAAEKIALIRKAIEAGAIPWLAATTDKLEQSTRIAAAVAAYDFANALRARRNEASHLLPLHDFDHTGETEEFLVSAGRHLRALWSVALDPPVP